jgi:hypothetical protein
LLDVGNRISVVYTPILDATVDPPVVGVRQPTAIAEDSDSQDRYGIVEKVLSGGTCFQADAERYRDTFLAENALPQTGETLAIGQGQIDGRDVGDRAGADTDRHTRMLGLFRVAAGLRVQ